MDKFVENINTVVRLYNEMAEKTGKDTIFATFDTRANDVRYAWLRLTKNAAFTTIHQPGLRVRDNEKVNYFVEAIYPANLYEPMAELFNLPDDAYECTTAQLFAALPNRITLNTGSYTADEVLAALNWMLERCRSDHDTGSGGLGALVVLDDVLAASGIEVNDAGDLELKG